MDNNILDINNRWDNVYWFSRMLINSDKYGGVGRENKLLAKIASSLKIMDRDIQNPIDKLSYQKQTLSNILISHFAKAKSRLHRVEQLVADLKEDIKTPEDMQVFIMTCESIMIPINNAIANMPNDDKEFTLSIAKTYLDKKGEEGLATVINLWDDLGVRGCLTAERAEIVKAFAILRILLNQDSISESEQNIILTSFVQELERRAGQKRKTRAGGSLQDVTSFILGYYGVKSAPQPDHFQADIEVDNFIKTKDGWLIGISCKRTLRERWKQVSSAESSVLSKYKIKYIYHVVTYDEDLSDDKLTLLGGLRHIFFLRDDSRILKHAQNHVGLKDYVKPMSEFIKIIKEQIG